MTVTALNKIEFRDFYIWTISYDSWQSCDMSIMWYHMGHMEFLRTYLNELKWQRRSSLFQKILMWIELNCWIYISRNASQFMFNSVKYTLLWVSVHLRFDPYKKWSINVISIVIHSSFSKRLCRLYLGHDLKGSNFC